MILSLSFIMHSSLFDLTFGVFEIFLGFFKINEDFVKILGWVLLKMSLTHHALHHIFSFNNVHAF